VNLLVKLNSIDNGKKIWWDVRPHPTFGRWVPDVRRGHEGGRSGGDRGADTGDRGEDPPSVHGKHGWRLYRRALIEENKWRAARYGIEGKLIDFGKSGSADEATDSRAIGIVDDVVDDLAAGAPWNMCIRS